MYKEEMKYIAPDVQIINVNVQGIVCVSPGVDPGDGPWGGGSEEPW